jgi:hypothetical protein
VEDEEVELEDDSLRAGWGNDKAVRCPDTHRRPRLMITGKQIDKKNALTKSVNDYQACQRY